MRIQITVYIYMLHGPHNNKLMFLKTAGVYCEIWALHIARIMTFPKGHPGRTGRTGRQRVAHQQTMDVCILGVGLVCECCYFSKLQKHGILS